MPELAEQSIGCPYCGESIIVLIDDSLPEQNYIEDCQVCCRPMDMRLRVFEKAWDLEACRDDD